MSPEDAAKMFVMSENNGRPGLTPPSSQESDNSGGQIRSESSQKIEDKLAYQEKAVEKFRQEQKNLDDKMHRRKKIKQKELDSITAEVDKLEKQLEDISATITQMESQLKKQKQYAEEMEFAIKGKNEEMQKITEEIDKIDEKKGNEKEELMKRIDNFFPESPPE